MSKIAAETALGSVRDAAGGGNEAEQLDMLSPPTRSNMTPDEAARSETAIKHDRRGRPPGARNIATRQMLEYVKKTMGDPAIDRFRWAMHTPESLAIAVGCTKYEALLFLDKLRADLMGYFYAKKAQVDDQGNAVAPRLTMVFVGQGGPQIGTDGSLRPPWEYLEGLNAESQQNQVLLTIEPSVSHGDVSHTEDNASDISDLEPSGR